MKPTKPTSLEEHYQEALTLHLLGKPLPAGLQAKQIGSDVFDAGMDAAGFSAIHSALLITLAPAPTTAALHKRWSARAAHFLAEVLHTLTGLASSKPVSLSRLQLDLARLTKDLAVSRKKMLQAARTRVRSEQALAQCDKSFQTRISESTLLEKQLQDQAHLIMEANEVGNQRLSTQLRDDIAQTLLGVYIKILALKTEVATSSHILLAEIAATQHLIETSAASIRRYAHELGFDHEK